MRKKRAKPPLETTSFRLEPDLREFIRERSIQEDRTMSYVVCGVLRMWMNYEKNKRRQPKAPEA